MSRAFDVWNPESLTVHFDTAQAILGQVLFFKTEKGKVWQIAENCLKPAVFSHDLSDTRVFKFIDVESKHVDVL